MSLSTTARVVDDISVPARLTHPHPVLLEEGLPPIRLGYIGTVDDITRAVGRRLRRVEFVTVQGDERSVVGVSIRSLRGSVEGSLVVIGDLTRSSSIQLRAPIDTVAVMTVDMETGEATLSCQPIGLACVTRVAEKSVGDDITWVTTLQLGSIVARWDSDVQRYKRNQKVPVRVTAEGHLAALN